MADISVQPADGAPVTIEDPPSSYLVEESKPDVQSPTNHQGVELEFSEHWLSLDKLPIRENLTLADFENVEFLADGGMSRVLSARMGGLEVVIKWIPPEQMFLQDCIKALHNEKRLLKQLRHPNIIKYLGCGKHENLPFLVLERLAGKDLLSALIEANKKKKRSRGFKVALYGLLDNTYHPTSSASGIYIRLRWALEVAEAVRFCHTQALSGQVLIHRDLKGNNVGMGQDGRIRLLDFGIAKEVAAAHRDDLTHAFDLTKGMGTKLYCAPEIFGSAQYSEKVDVYSFGTLFWELLASQVPRQSLRDQMRAALRGAACRGEQARPTPPPNPLWGPDIASVMHGCWEADAARRPDFGEVCRQLGALVRGFEQTGLPQFAPEEGGAAPVGSGAGGAPAPITGAGRLPSLGTGAAGAAGGPGTGGLGKGEEECKAEQEGLAEGTPASVPDAVHQLFTSRKGFEKK